MTAKFDPVAFYEEAYARIRKETGREDCHGEALSALAAEAAKQQARKDAEICREWALCKEDEAHDNAIAPQIGDGTAHNRCAGICAQAIEKEVGL